METSGEEIEVISAITIGESKQKLPPIHLACGDDDMRPNLCLVEIRNNIATASNGHILVKIDLSKMEDLPVDVLKIINGKFIHREVWKEIYKCDMLEFFEDKIDCLKKGIKRTFYYSESQGEFFNSDTIIIGIKEAGEESKRLMSYNAKFIEILMNIFQSSNLHFSFSKGNNGTIVFPSEESGMFAVLMPMDYPGINRYLFY